MLLSFVAAAAGAIYGAILGTACRRRGGDGEGEWQGQLGGSCGQEQQSSAGTALDMAKVWRGMVAGCLGVSFAHEGGVREG